MSVAGRSPAIGEPDRCRDPAQKNEARVGTDCQPAPQRKFHPAADGQTERALGVFVDLLTNLDGIKARAIKGENQASIILLGIHRNAGAVSALNRGDAAEEIGLSSSPREVIENIAGEGEALPAESDVRVERSIVRVATDPQLQSEFAEDAELDARLEANASAQSTLVAPGLAPAQTSLEGDARIGPFGVRSSQWEHRE